VINRCGCRRNLTYERRAAESFERTPGEEAERFGWEIAGDMDPAVQSVPRTDEEDVSGSLQGGGRGTRTRETNARLTPRQKLRACAASMVKRAPVLPEARSYRSRAFAVRSVAARPKLAAKPAARCCRCAPHLRDRRDGEHGAQARTGARREGLPCFRKDFLQYLAPLVHPPFHFFSAKARERENATEVLVAALDRATLDQPRHALRPDRGMFQQVRERHHFRPGAKQTEWRRDRLIGDHAQERETRQPEVTCGQLDAQPAAIALIP